MARGARPRAGMLCIIWLLAVPQAFAVHGSFRVESLPLPGYVPDAVFDTDNLGTVVVWSPIVWGHTPRSASSEDTSKTAGYGYVSAHQMPFLACSSFDLLQL